MLNSCFQRHRMIIDKAARNFRAAFCRSEGWGMILFHSMPQLRNYSPELPSIGLRKKKQIVQSPARATTV